MDRAEHYVYILYREDGVTPFYVGMGKGDRWLDHEKCAKSGQSSHKGSIIRSMLDRGLSVSKQKFAEALTRENAAALEIELIAMLGREPNGLLVNATRGGYGVVDLPISTLRSAALKRATAKRGRPLSEEHRKKISEAHLGKKLSEAHVVALRACRIGKAATEKQIAANRAIGEKRRGCNFSAEHRAKLSAAAKRSASDPKWRAAVSNRLRGRYVSEESREKNRLAHLGKPWSESRRERFLNAR